LYFDDDYDDDDGDADADGDGDSDDDDDDDDNAIFKHIPSAVKMLVIPSLNISAPALLSALQNTLQNSKPHPLQESLPIFCLKRLV